MMLSARVLAQLSDVAMRDARAAVDPHEHADWSPLSQPARAIDVWDRDEAAYLERVSVRAWEAAVLVGWGAWASPWLSDEENEAIRVAYWDEVLP